MDLVPTRLIICVDGTCCTPDGSYGKPYYNISNIYRVCASIKSGVVVDPCGRSFKQEKVYYPGIGSKDDIAWVQRLQIGAFGNECIAQIRELYKRCCSLPGHPDDEIWLYGFSRGAYVVRAVGGLLHYLRVLTSAGTDEFETDYEQALKVYETLQKSSKLGPAQIHDYFSGKTRAAPKIQFVGAFDTVKAVNDRFLYDISFNESIKHLRHALALDETRAAFTPEYMFPEFNSNQLRKRSFVQAWFVGAHGDMGGSAAKDGLSLYPLQWMLIESRLLGLVLEFDGSFESWAKIDNPLDITRVNDEEGRPSTDIWSCKANNGLSVMMQDLRPVHKDETRNGCYGVHLNNRCAVYWTKQIRRPFNREGDLLGYCSYAPQGTIIHPSVYLIFDEFCHVLLNSKNLVNHNDIERWRSQVLPEPKDGTPTEFWNEREIVTIEEPRAIRVLICGNCGVGKSSLVNEVFGVEVTNSSNRETGRHDVDEGFTSASRPDLIIHDSGGFEAGGTDELTVVQKFVSKMSETTDIKSRLHVIWFCIELNSARTKQKGTVDLFKILSQTAKCVPIVVIGTKKDEFIGVKVAEARRKARKGNGDESLAAFDAYAEAQFVERMKEIEGELLSIEGGRFDAAVGVSIDPDDRETIEQLTEETARCFDHEKIRLLYISAQITRIDLKVDMAIAETMRIYKHTVRSAVASGFLPGGPPTTRVAVFTVVCKTIFACFGLPTVSATTIVGLIDAVCWEDIGRNFPAYFAEGLSTVCCLGGFNAPLVVPNTARLFLILACDVILILVRAFAESTKKCVGQPMLKDVEEATAAYRQISNKIHRKVERIVPRHNMIRSFERERVREYFEQVVGKYKDLVTAGIGSGTNLKVLDATYDSDDEATLWGTEEKMRSSSIDNKS